jgi:hypothetical protein
MNYNMTGTKNQRTATVLTAIAALASVLIVNAVAIGTGSYIALTRHHDDKSRE